MIREKTHVEGVKSTAAVAGHPMHPMLIPFPIAFLTGALVTDVIYWLNDVPFWAEMSFWLIVGGVVMGALAAVVGLIDFLTIARVRAHTAGWLHAGLNAGALVLALLNLWLRWGARADGVLPWGVVLSVITAVLLGVSGWYGGELAYRHKVGVIDEVDVSPDGYPRAGRH
ncbi:MAG: DUF2231 domain-containing protein [Anaerolineales bacterium]|nr:DUF2231 domain-containing protein [Anaerolineales bacterium]